MYLYMSLIYQALFIYPFQNYINMLKYNYMNTNFNEYLEFGLAREIRRN